MAAVIPIDVTNSFILKPTSPSPHPLVNTSMPLNIFDKAAGNVHFPTLLAYRNMPPNPQLIASLSRNLHHYPHLSGRITLDSNNRPSYSLNNAGIRLIETYIPTRLTDTSLLEDIENHKSLYPPVTEDTQELFQIQLNRYACGGLVIGSRFSHLVADGQSMGKFLQSWAGETRGDAALPTPYNDHNALFVPNDPPNVKFDHLEVQSTGISSLPRPANGVENLVVQFPGEFISRLKKSVPFRCTTFECLLAHLWRKSILVRGLPADEITRVRVAVNGRARMRPVVTEDYFGNLVLWALPKAEAGELVSKDIGHAVGLVRKAVARMDDEYYRSAIDFGAVIEKEGLEESMMGDEEDWEHMLYPDLEVDSWLGFRFNAADFGLGGPCAVVPPNLPIEGVMAFISSATVKGGVDAFLTIRKEHVEDFRRVCMSLE